MFGVEYFVLIDEIIKALKGECFRSDVKNLEKIDVGTFKISNDSTSFNIIIANVVFISCLDELINLINNQISEVKIFRIKPDHQQTSYVTDRDPWGIDNYFSKRVPPNQNIVCAAVPPIKIENLLKGHSGKHEKRDINKTNPVYVTIPPTQIGASEKSPRMYEHSVQEDPETSFYHRQKCFSDAMKSNPKMDDFIIEKIVGVTHDNRQEIIKTMKEGDVIILHREPENKHDKNAIKVENLSGFHLGYINRISAALYAPVLDEFNEPIRGEVLNLNHGYDSNSFYGLTIRFKITSGQQPQYFKEL